MKKSAGSRFLTQAPYVVSSEVVSPGEASAVWKLAPTPRACSSLYHLAVCVCASVPLLAAAVAGIYTCNTSTEAALVGIGGRTVISTV